jgi:hypothetical protein
LDSQCYIFKKACIMLLWCDTLSISI